LHGKCQACEADQLTAEVRRLREREVRRLREREEVALMTLAHSTDTVARLETRVRDLESDLAQLREVVELARAVVRCWEDDEHIDAAFDDLRAAVNRTEAGS
jgi:hypothetical protein